MEICKLSIGTSHGCILSEQTTKIFFDPPSLIIDNKAQIKSISDKMKYIEIEALANYPSDLSAIFISSSSSLGVFFTPSHLPIYVTEIVYLQMKETLKHYVGLGPIRRTTKTSTPQAPNTIIQEVSAYRSIASRVKLITFSQHILFPYLTVIAQSSNTCVGWACYHVQRGNKYVFSYTHGVKGNCTLSHELKPPTTSVSLFIKHFHQPAESDPASFSTDLLNLAKTHTHLVVTMDVMAFSIELTLHLLSLVKDKHVAIYHPGFKKLLQCCEHKRELLSTRFSIDYANIQPILSSSTRLRTLSFKDLAQITTQKPAIVICDRLDHKLFLSKLPALHLPNYSFKFFGTIQDALAYPWVSTLYLPFPPPTAHPQIVVLPETPYALGTSHHLVTIHNTQHVQRVASGPATTFHFRGSFQEDATGLTLVCEESPLQALIQHPSTQKFQLKETLICTNQNETFRIKRTDKGLEVISICGMRK
ncbi:hypothetical protein NEHOM01_1729 [Nematocida homosporus]|uniref:uncharacterized protein n=1 Tax=Nematocida homosporus TaxID=1912981 RepID=UPI00221F91E9|nr:uncharacterized protein NEHOM01_1729 [Nematocida homosporus]KAI5186828.1 hypothetical protein NEHOM01_1729 [Nematocida homosporus]